MSEQHHPFGPSSLARRELCPASYRMEKDLPGFSTDDANEGTRLHAEIAKLITTAISSDDPIKFEDETVSAMFDKFMEILAVDTVRDASDLAKKLEENESMEIYVEHPLSFRYAGLIQYHGTADVLAVTSEKVIVIDWKTGHRQVDEARNNIQLAAYALAAMQEYKRDKADVYIYNPVIHQDTHASFEDANAIKQYIMGVIARCEDDNAPVCPSEDACRYCKAAYHGTCPALAKETEAVAVRAEKLVPLPSISDLSTDALCELKRKCDLIAKLGERVDNRIKAICEESGQCGEWKMKEVSGGREITDINKAFQLSGMSPDSFLGCCSCSISKLEKQYGKDGKESGAFKTEKDAKAELNAKLAEVIAAKPTKKTLVRVEENR